MLFKLSKTRLKGNVFLLAEDNEINRLIASEILEDLSMEVIEAQDGKQALDMVLSDEFDVILMDIQMPVMDGIEATQEIIKQTSGKACANCGYDSSCDGKRD